MAMSKAPDIFDLPETFTCPSCENEISCETPVSAGPNEFRKGKIVICGHCACILRVGDSMLVKCTPDEMKLLNKQTRLMIQMAVMGVIKTLSDRHPKAN